MFAAPAQAQTITTTPLGGGQTRVQVSWFAEAFSTMITGSGVQMPLPTTKVVCKFYPRLGNRCLTVVSGGASFYTAFSGAYSGADHGQCTTALTYVSGYGYAPQLPVSCVGSLTSGTGFLVSFTVTGTGSVSVGDQVVVVS